MKGLVGLSNDNTTLVVWFVNKSHGKAVNKSIHQGKFTKIDHVISVSVNDYSSSKAVALKMFADAQEESLIKPDQEIDPASLKQGDVVKVICDDKCYTGIVVDRNKNKPDFLHKKVVIVENVEGYWKSWSNKCSGKCISKVLSIEGSVQCAGKYCDDGEARKLLKKWKNK